MRLSTSATSVRVVHEESCPDIGPICAMRDEPPQLHDQRFDLLELRLTAEYGLTDRYGVEVQLPLRVSDTTVQYARLDGTPFTPDYPQIHHRNETLVGPGDPWLLGRVALRAGRVMLGAKLGVSLPLGRTEENPFALGDMGIPHQHVQLGTGTFDPIAMLDASVPLGARSTVAAHGQAQITAYENARGYRAGSRYAMGLVGRVTIGRGFSVAATVDVAGERPERWDGQILQDGNLGRTDVLVGGGVSWGRGAWALSLGVRAPVYQDIVTVGDEAGQLTYPAIVDFTLSRTIDPGGE